jgi:hypothetical protein
VLDRESAQRHFEEALEHHAAACRSVHVTPKAVSIVFGRGCVWTGPGAFS